MLNEVYWSLLPQFRINKKEKKNVTVQYGEMIEFYSKRLFSVKLNSDIQFFAMALNYRFNMKNQFLLHKRCQLFLDYKLQNNVNVLFCIYKEYMCFGYIKKDQKWMQPVHWRIFHRNQAKQIFSFCNMKFIAIFSLAICALVESVPIDYQSKE